MPSADEVPERPHDFPCHADDRVHAEDCECWCHDAAEAMQALVDLTEELGLYGETDAAGENRVVAPVCPFCGLPMPCPSHRMGGPA